MEEIIFTKMHGAGNDYIYVNCLESVPQSPERLAVAISDRHKGVGADGLILILPSQTADFRMRMFNADGSEGKMCGNASRCIAKYVYDSGLVAPDTTDITLETLAGIKTLHLNFSADHVIESVTVDMGIPEIYDTDLPISIGGESLKVMSVSMGNPHAVIFIDHHATDYEVLTLGPQIEHHSHWPDRTNVEWAHVVSPHLIYMRVWERGSGETLACGTGACATAVAAINAGLTDRSVDVRLLGGTLHIHWRADDGHVLMTGPAATIMTGRYFFHE